jgi:O-antigen/teichoic acid export membrane protein
LNERLFERDAAVTELLLVASEPPTEDRSIALPEFLTRAKVSSSTSRAAIAVREGAWSISGYVATQLLRTVATLVLAQHFLGPEPFGIVGLIGVFLAGLTMFSELGILTNVVQHPRGDDPEFLNTAFSIQVGRGAVIWAAAAIAAYPFALFYKLPILFPLLVTAGFSEMIRGLTSTAAWTLTRHVNLRNITLLTVASEVVAFVVAVTWAAVSPSAWALVAKTIAAAAVFAVGSHFIAKPRIRFGWEKSAAKDLLHFGGWISVATAAYFLGSQSERLVLGKFITPAELGCFSLAVMISAVPTGGVTQLVSQIFLPMISNTVRTSREGTVRDFLLARKGFFALGLLSGIGFLAFANPLVRLVLTPKYAMVGWMLQLLGLRVALDLFAAPTSNLILAYAKTKYAALGNATRLLLMVVGVWIAFSRFGMRAAVIALVIAQALSYLPLIVALFKLLPELAWRELAWYSFFVAILGLATMIPWARA